MFPFLWIGPARGDDHGTPLSSQLHRPLHFAFLAPSIEAVNAFHAAGLAHGGRDNSAPEDCGDGYYAAYLIDPDGNNIEAVFHGEAERSAPSVEIRFDG